MTLAEQKLEPCILTAFTSTPTRLDLGEQTICFMSTQTKTRPINLREMLRVEILCWSDDALGRTWICIARVLLAIAAGLLSFLAGPLGSHTHVRKDDKSHETTKHLRPVSRVFGCSRYAGAGIMTLFRRF